MVFANAPDRAFLAHSLFLFSLSFTIIAASQSSYILTTKCCSLTSADFLAGKLATDVMAIAGGNGYGNTSNFVMLLVAVLPFVAASIYISDQYRVAKAALLIFLTYSCLLVYSRGALMIIAIALGTVFTFFSYKTKTLKMGNPDHPSL
jgi:hypothetical protein